MQDRKERDSLAEVGQSNFLHLQEGSCPEEKKWSAGESFPVGYEVSVTFYHLDSRVISRRELEARVGGVLVQRLWHPGHEKTFQIRAGR